MDPGFRSDIAAYIARDLQISDARAVEAALKLLVDGGSSIHFVARYRKNETGSLNPDQLRAIQKAYTQHSNFESRRDSIVTTLEKKGALKPSLRAQLSNAQTLTELEDIYAPFKKRTTKASEAREKGLGELADRLLTDSTLGDQDFNSSIQNATKSHKISEIEAIEGLRHIIAETIFWDADLKKILRVEYQRNASIESKRSPQFIRDSGKFRDYYTFKRDCRSLNAHQILALNRGESEKELKIKVLVNKEAMQRKIEGNFEAVISQRRKFQKLKPNQEGTQILLEGLSLGFKKSIHKSLTREIRNELTERAELQAISVYQKNLGKLLLARGVRSKRVMALDPGFKNGCKLAFIDESGKVVGFDVIFPLPPRNETEKYFLINPAEKWLSELIEKFGVEVAAIGNGQGSREAELFLSTLIKNHSIHSKTIKNLKYCIVSESGASVYSAAPIADEELPNLDVSYRGAVSIARRLQDPLSELCKIPPESMGVGMYQHDVNQGRLRTAAEATVDDCVNLVGVNLNTATVPLLRYVSGLDARKAESIVFYRNKHGRFQSRNDLMKVDGIGPKTFELAAGFFRIFDGSNPFDATGIHPESYASAGKLLTLLARKLIPTESFKESELAQETLRNGSRIRSKILNELERLKARRDELHALAKEVGISESDLVDLFTEFQNGVGFDPRDLGDAVILRSGAMSLSELKPGQVVTGTITNVVDFGAFVDIGVGQDGLIHTSRMPKGADLGVGDSVTVTIDSVDLPRKRISLSVASTKSPQSQVQDARTDAKAETEKRQEDRGGAKERNVSKGGLFAKALANVSDAKKDLRHKEEAPIREKQRDLERDRQRMDHRKEPSSARNNFDLKPQDQVRKRKREEEEQKIEIERLRDLEEEAKERKKAIAPKPRLSEKEREKLEREAFLAAKKKADVAKEGEKAKPEGLVTLDFTEEKEPPKKRIRLDLVESDST